MTQTMPRITLEALHIDFADDLARRRQESAERRNRPPASGAPTDRAKALRLNIIGARAEAAAKLYLNPVEWHAFVDHDLTGLPDFDDFIDAKGVDISSHRLIVQRFAREDWAYLLIRGHMHPVYFVIGWAWGHEVKKKEFLEEKRKGEPSYFAPNSILRPPADLIAELRRRQSLREGARRVPGS